MFSKYGTLASTLLKRGLADPTSLALSRHTNVSPFRSSIYKIRRNYCANTKSLSNEILEVLDSPEIIGRDHKHYRVLKLKNGLTALLISDPVLYPFNKLMDGVKATGDPNERETDIEKLGACSVSVDVGSLHSLTNFFSDANANANFDRFLLPVSFYYFNLISHMARGSIENIVMLSVYTMLLRYKVVESLYPATVAGLGYTTIPSDRGILLKFSGYSQSLHHLVKAFIAKLLTFADEITEDEFNMFAEQQLKNYFNTMINPKAYAKALRLSIIDNEFYPTHEKYEALKRLTINDFKQYANRFLKEMKVQALFQGNLNQDTAQTVMNDVLDQLKPQPILNSSAMELQAHKLPVGAHYFRCASLNPNDVNSLTCNFYQIGPMSVKTLNLIELLMMLAEEPLFNTLRSKEQLGYDENKFSSEYIDERIEAFRSKLLNIISRTTDREFQQYKESLAKIKLNDDMKDEVSRHWMEIITNEYAFDRAIRDVECLNTITKSDFVEFFEKHFHRTKKLSIQIIGVRKVSANTNSTDRSPNGQEFTLKMIPLSKPFKGYCIESIPDFVKSLKLYPVIRTNFKCEE